MGDLALHVSGNYFGLKRQTDVIPTRMAIGLGSVSILHTYIIVRLTLIPHTLIVGKGIRYWTVEVVEVNQQMV
jgi:hypothetical protein